MVSYITEHTPTWAALQVHLGLGAAFMSIFSYYFGRNYILTKKPQSRIFKALPLVSSLFTTFYYAVLLIIYNTEDSALTGVDPIVIRFISWFLTTPPLLAAVALLEPSSIITDILFLCTMDGMMIISGYLAHMATRNAAIWSFYSVGLVCAYTIINIMMLKYKRLNSKKIKGINIYTYNFLSIYTLIVWGCFPILFIFYKIGLIAFEFETILYVYLDIFAKGFFGIILIGARDIMDNKPTRAVRFARMVVHVYPMEDTITEEEVVTDTSITTPPPSLDTLTPAEQAFITGVPPHSPSSSISPAPPPSSPHSVISVKNNKNENAVEKPLRKK